MIIIQLWWITIEKNTIAYYNMEIKKNYIKNFIIKCYIRSKSKGIEKTYNKIFKMLRKIKNYHIMNRRNQILHHKYLHMYRYIYHTENQGCAVTHPCATLAMPLSTVHDLEQTQCLIYHFPLAMRMDQDVECLCIRINVLASHWII